eukprot:scaffold18406_cov80-Skeletonema_marinoi.AAC.1
MGGGGDCDRPACDDTKSALSAALQRVGEARVASKNSTKQSTYTECPPTREESGTSTWSLLHSMAAWHLQDFIPALGVQRTFNRI